MRFPIMQLCAMCPTHDVVSSPITFPIRLGAREMVKCSRTMLPLPSQIAPVALEILVERSLPSTVPAEISLRSPSVVQRFTQTYGSIFVAARLRRPAPDSESR